MSYHEAIVPVVTASLMAVSTAVIDAASAVPMGPMLAMAVSVVSALVGAAVSYGILKGTVSAIKESHHDLKQSIDKMDGNVTNLIGRVSNIEGRMARRRGDAEERE